jgi:hypothetical protein
MSASTAIVYERFRMLGATDSGTSAQPGIVDMAISWSGDLPAFGAEDLYDTSALRREGVVLASLGPPQCDELLQLLRVLCRDVVTLAGVEPCVEQLPLQSRVVGSRVGAAGESAAAFQPSCQMARVPPIE